MVRLTHDPTENIGRIVIPRDKAFNITEKQGVAIGPFVPFPGPKKIGRCEAPGTWWPMEPREKWILRINEAIHVCCVMLGHLCGNLTDPLYQLTMHLSWGEGRRILRRRILRRRDEKNIRKWLDELIEWQAAYYRSFPDDQARWDLRSCCHPHY